MKKIFSLILAIALVMAMAVPAMAAEPTYSITINHPTAATEHTYEAYQIFTGKIDTTGHKLTEIEWGDGIDEAALLTELMKDAAWAAKVTATTTAEGLADLLADQATTTAMFETFRTAAGASLTTTVAASADTATNGKYVIDLANAGPGYYLVKDKDDTLEGTLETYTNYILRVVGQDELHPKGGSTTVDKVIVDGGQAKEAADYSIGDTVHFRVTGTLPANYTAFTTFEYQIVDTMSKGLTYIADSVKVYLENAGTKVELTNPEGVDPYFTVSHDADTNVLTVTFPDLKKITGRTIDASTIIIMEYDTVLNQSAEIGEPGNPNNAKLIFDNDPYSDGKGETPEDYAWAFTWELDVTKTDDLEQPLKDAKFVFYRELMGEKQYVILSENKVTGWTKDKTQATVIVSPETGVMPIIGLEADTYYLEETEAPDGYNLLDAPVPVVITATAGGVNSTGDGYDITNLSVKVGTGEIKDGNVDTGIVEGSVINKSGTVLPETGGVGTTLFYVIGGLMVGAAIVLLVTKKRMAAN